MAGTGDRLDQPHSWHLDSFGEYIPAGKVTDMTDSRDASATEEEGRLWWGRVDIG